MEPNLDTPDGRFAGYCLAQQLSFVANKTANDARSAMRGASDQARAILDQYLTTSKNNRDAYAEVADAILNAANEVSDDWVRGDSVCPPAPERLNPNRLNGISPMGAIPLLTPIAITWLSAGVAASAAFLTAGYAISLATQGKYLAYEESKQKAIRAFVDCQRRSGTDCQNVLKSIGKPPGVNLGLIVAAIAATGIAFLYFRS
tara:strand:- start:3905 stop:4513 length:609 start_codon:yes stop_codon:yes gene_type:complete